MSGKSLFKLIVFVILMLFLLTLLSGCKNKKDVYATGSDYIEVSHPDKPNVNKFSQDELDTFYDNSTSSQNNSRKDSNDLISSDESTLAPDDTSAAVNNSNSNISSDNSNTNNGSSGDTVSNPDESGGTGGTDNKTIGDQSPVVTFQ